MRPLSREPEIVARTARRQQHTAITEGEVMDALHGVNALWDELFPAEQARIVQLLVSGSMVGESGTSIRLRTEGLTSLVRDDARQGGGMSARPIGTLVTPVRAARREVADPLGFGITEGEARDCPQRAVLPG